MKKAILFFAIMIVASTSFAKCGYGTITSVRVDDSRGDFRIAFKSVGTSNNGCDVLDLTAIVKPSYGYVGADTNAILAICLSAMNTGNQVWIEYDWSGSSSGANFLKRINLYNSAP